MSLICSQAPPADGALDCIGLDFAPSRPARSTSGDVEPMHAISQTCVFTPMCGNSPQLALWPTSDTFQSVSSAVRPVRTPAAPTPKAGASMERRPGFSWKPSASSSKADRLGLALRTALGCELEALTGCSLSWSKRATPAGRSWWVLTTLARPTSENACGLFVPTPSATQYGSNQGGAAGRAGPVRPSLRKMVVPTPLAQQGRRTHRGSSRMKANGKRGADLNSMMLAMPLARDATHSAKGVTARNSRPLNEQLERKGGAGTVVLAGVYEWLLGFPPGWLANALQPTETRSSRRSRN